MKQNYKNKINTYNNLFQKNIYTTLTTLTIKNITNHLKETTKTLYLDKDVYQTHFQVQPCLYL